MTLSGAVALPAHAVTPTVRLAAPVAAWHAASTQWDGSNSSVHLAADVTGLTAAELAVVSVRFAAKLIGGTRSDLAVDGTAPFSTEWSAAPGTYDLIAEVLDNAGRVTATTTTPGVTVSATASSVHVASTSEGGLLGWYRAAGGATGNVAVSGTRSANGPRVDVSVGPSWNAAAVGSQSWTVAAPVNPAAPPTGDTPGTTTPTWLTAAAVNASGTQASDEAIPVSLYLQRLTGAAAPTSVTGARNADIPVPVVVTDEFGRPIVGLPVTGTATGTATGGATVVTGATTDATGTALLTVRSTVTGASTLTLSTRYGAAFDPTVDRRLTTTLSTYAAIPTSLVLSSASGGTVLAPASYNTNVVTATVRDQNGNLLAGATVNARETVTRTSTGSVTSRSWSSGAGLASTTDAQGRLTLAHDPAVGSAGTDVYDLYLELDGIAGRSASDLGAAALPLRWATSSLLIDPCIVSACATQQQTGAIGTYTVREAVGTAASAGRTLALAVTSGSGASFAAAQPGATTRTSATTATCTTDGSGACAFALVDNVAETAVVRVTDTGPGAGSGATAATLTVSVRAHSVALHHVVTVGTSVIDPLGAPSGSAPPPPPAAPWSTARPSATSATSRSPTRMWRSPSTTGS